MPQEGLKLAPPGFRMPKEDYGAAAALQVGVVSGFKSSIGGSLGRAASYWYDRNLSDSPAISADDFKKHYGDLFQHAPGMTWQEAENRMQDIVKDGIEAQQGQGHMTANIAGSFVGGMSNPLDLMVNVALPEVGILSLASKTGKTAESLLAVNAARMSLGRTIDATVNQAATGAVQALVTEPFVYAADMYSQRNHDILDSLHNIGVSTGMGGLVGIGKTAWKAYSPDLRMRIAAAALGAAEQGAKVDPLTGLVASTDNGVAARARTVKDVLAGIEPPEDIHGMDAPTLRRAGFFSAQDVRETIAKVREQGLKVFFKQKAEGPTQEYGTIGGPVREGGVSIKLSTFDSRLEATISALREELRGLTKNGTVKPEHMERAQTVQSELDRLVVYREGMLARAEETQRTAAEQLKGERDVERSKRARKAMEASRAAANDDEHLLNEVFKRMFGVEVRFFSKEVAADTRFYGLTSSKEPRYIYVRAGTFEGKLGMLPIAGHELGHNIRIRDPKMWLDITESMLSMSRNPVFAEAWKEVAGEKSRKNEWMGMTRNERMDEVYANTLGHAMMVEDFWVNLQRTSPRTADTLAAYVAKIKETVTKHNEWQQSMLGDPTIEQRSDSMEAAKLSERLGYILSHFDRTKGKESAFDTALNNLADPGTTDRGLIFAAYERQAARFAARQREAVLRWNDLGRRAAYSADKLDRALSSLFYQGGSLKDSSLAPGVKKAAIVTITRKVKGDVRNYLIRSFYKDQQSKNPAMRRAFEAVVKERMSAKEGVDRGPLVTWKDLGDGNYEFTFWHNDKHPVWSENRKPGDMLDDWDKTIAAEHRDELAAGFAEDMRVELEKGAARGEDGKFRSRREAFFEDLSDEAGDWARTLSNFDRREMSQMDLVESFRDYLDERMAEKLAADDKDAYGNLLDMRKELTDIDAVNGPGEEAPEWVKTLWQSNEEARKAALDLFREDNPGIDFNDPKLERWDFNTGDVLYENLATALDNLRETMFNDLLAQITEPRKMTNRAAEVASLYNWMSDSARNRFHESLRAEVENIIHDEFPHYREMLNLPKDADSADAYFVSLDQAGNVDTDGNTHQMPDTLRESDDYHGMSMDPKEAALMQDRVVKGREAEADAALDRALNRLSREHASMIEWLQNPEKASKNHLDELLQRNQLKDFAVTPEEEAKQRLDGPVVKPERTKAQEQTLSRLSELKQAMKFATEDLALIASGKEPKGNGVYAKARWLYHLKRLHGEKLAALEAANKDIQFLYLNKMRGAVMDLEARTNLLAKARKSIKQLFSFLDGQAREGVIAPGDSVNARRNALAYADASALHQGLQRYGLMHLWADQSLVKKVVAAIEGVKHSDQFINDIAEILRATNDMQAARLNKLGGGYRLLDNFAFSQVHDPARIMRNVEGWKAYLVENVDWERTKLFADVDPNNPKSIDSYLDSVLEAVSEENPEPYDPTTMGGNVLNETSLRRTVHLKPGKSVEYDMTFGTGDTGGHIFSSIARRAESAAFAEAFGVDRKGNWNSVMTDMGMRFSSKFSDIRLANLTFEHLMGNFDNPVDQSLARMGRTMRLYMNGVSLWMSGISSMTDVGNCVSAIRWAGVPVADAHGSFLRAAKSAAQSAEGRAALQGQMAGMQAILGGYTRAVGETGFERFAQKMSDMTFKWSGNALSTRVYQEAMTDVLSRHFGEMAKGENNEMFKNWLSHYGITPEMWKQMSKHAAKVEGLEGTRLAPDLIPDEKLAQALRTAMNDTITYGNLQPSISDEALIRMGTRAGTMSGEAIRSIGQYKGYALAVIRKVSSRFAYAYGNGKGDGVFMGIPTGGVGLREKLVWAGGMATLAFMVLGIKDVLKGREPMNPFDTNQWTFGNVGRVVVQAGVGPLATIEQFSSLNQAAGPAPGAAIKLGQAFLGDSQQEGAGYRKTEALFGALPFASLGPLTEARRSLLGYIFAESYGQALQGQRQWLTDQTGQGRLLTLGDGPRKH